MGYCMGGVSVISSPKIDILSGIIPKIVLFILQIILNSAKLQVQESKVDFSMVFNIYNDILNKNEQNVWTQLSQSKLFF